MAHNDLFPREALPLPERKLAPACIALHTFTAANRLSRFIRTQEIAADRAIESFTRKNACKRLCLGAPLGIKRNIDLALKPPVAIPIGRAVAYERVPDVTPPV